MSDWYSRALQRAQPGRASAPQPSYPAQQQRPQFDSRVSPTPPPQEVPTEFMPAEIQWAYKLANAAKNAVRNGIAHKTDTTPCPQCGGNQFFSRGQGNKRMPPPAPHCYNCGYNEGLFDQGLESSWIGGSP